MRERLHEPLNHRLFACDNHVLGVAPGPRFTDTLPRLVVNTNLRANITLEIDVNDFDVTLDATEVE